MASALRTVRLILSCCARSTPNMRIAQQEVFAPIMLVMTYRGDVKDAIRLANGTRYGLGASVFGRDKKQCDQVVEGLECGMVCTNGE